MIRDHSLFVVLTQAHERIATGHDIAGEATGHRWSEGYLQRTHRYLAPSWEHVKAELLRYNKPGGEDDWSILSFSDTGPIQGFIERHT